MFKLHKIQLSNFRAYKGVHDFTFPVENGLFYFTGVNHLEGLGANGAGKSTFMDAITWCLYGQTTRGLKAGDVLHGWMGSCGVETVLTVGDRQATVKRTQKPNSLTLDGIPVDQTELERYLCLNVRAFLCSIVNAQFGTPFFSLTAAEKLSLFSDLMNLNFWLECSQSASGASTELEGEITNGKQKINSLEASIASTQADLCNLTAREQDFEARSLERKKELSQRRKALLVCKDRISPRSTALRGRIKLLARRRQATLVEIKERERAREHCMKSLHESLEYKARAEGELQAIENRIEKLKHFPDICPTCKQRANHAHIMKEASAEKRLHTTLTGTVVATIKTLNQLRKDVVLAKTALDAEIEKANTTAEELDVAKAELAKLEQEYANLQVERDLLKVEIDKPPDNPYTELLLDKTKALELLILSLRQGSLDVAALGARQVATSYWIKGFKQIRLHVIEQAFVALELEVNNCLSQLGMQDWQITFDVERENKSGNVTKGFTVLVKSPSNKEYVRWENWSGGETQRLQLAGALGLANLIMQQAGLTNTIEFYDEPSTHLSPEGMLDLANLLHERAVNEGKQIWIVDHAAIANYGEFTGVIEARKDENGSSIHFR